MRTTTAVLVIAGLLLWGAVLASVALYDVTVPDETKCITCPGTICPVGSYWRCDTRPDGTRYCRCVITW